MGSELTFKGIAEDTADTANTGSDLTYIKSLFQDIAETSDTEYGEWTNVYKVVIPGHCWND